MNLSQFIRYWQGERRGMGSQLAAPRMEQRTLYEFYSSITIPNEVLLSDVSFYQADIDFAKMKAAGLAGVILRAGQRYWIDSKYGVNQAQAKAAGLPRGSYWFYDGREDPKKQAALLWSIVKDSGLELWYVMDLEDNYGGAYANKASRRTFIEEFQRLSGLPDDRILIYSGFYWWNENMGNDAWFRKYRLWLAWYAAESAVRVPAPWLESDLVLWQYTSSGDGLRYGVSSLEIDLDWYNGTPAQFTAEYGLPTGGTMLWYRATGNITMRTAANSTSANAQIGGVNQYVLTDDLVETSVQSNGFVLISRVYRNGGFVELPPVAWCGMAYLAEAEAPILTPSVYITHVFSDTLILDGKQYKADFTVENVEYKPQS